MPSQGLNFLWLNLDFPAPADPADGSLRQPLPEKYIENIRQAAARNPQAEIMLWVDSKRLTARQIKHLRRALENGPANIRFRDLRDIPAYNNDPLYNQGETNPRWRDPAQNSLIWRQVDAAKILLCLQDDFDQTFFADLDRSHIEINGAAAQNMLEKHGMFFCSPYADRVSFENQAWGFTQGKRGFFEQCYAAVRRGAGQGLNGYAAMQKEVYLRISKEGAPLEDFFLMTHGDGTQAEHPGHKWRAGDGGETTPAGIKTGFNAAVQEEKAAAPRPAQKAPPAPKP